jgi:hypothetical protein
MHEKHPLIVILCQVVSNGRWNTMWFCTIEDLFPLKYESPKYGQEDLDLSSRSYKLALNSIKGEKVVAINKLQVSSRSSKEGSWKGINTH